MLLAVMLCLSAFSVAEFRVGEAWQPIPFNSSMFYLGYGDGTWVFFETPGVFQYKDLGDTIVLKIGTISGGGTTGVDARQLVINLSYAIPVIPGPAATQTGTCTVLIGWDKYPATFDIYPGGGIVIWPMKGVFPNDLFPAGSVGVFIETTYAKAPSQ